MSDKDVDAQFADIVAHWDDDEVTLPGPDESAPPPPRGTVNPPLLPNLNPPLRPADEQPPPLERPFVVWRGATPTAGPGDRDQDPGPAELAFSDDDDHFEPGPTAPLPPQEDVQFWGIIVGLVAGPLLLLWLVVFRPDVSGWWTFAALALTLTGFVLLVLRQPHRRDEDDPDNGARV
jgi:hypothetical protein